MTIKLLSRKFFCDNSSCSRSIFTERFENLVKAYSRRTERLNEALVKFSFSLSSEAALQNEQFFSLSELNYAICEKLKAFNARLFQKKEGSRVSLFSDEELPLLAPLPAIDIEYNSRKNSRLRRLMKNADFDQPDASIMDIDYTSGRKLNKELITRLATCEYIAEYRNIFITGATGSGKTYMACAFGMEACKKHYPTKYVRLPDLLLDLELARDSGSYKKVMAKYANPLLLIIDEWLLLKPTENERKDISMREVYGLDKNLSE